MSTECNARRNAGISEPVQPEHHSRSDVLRYHFNRALSETRMTFDRFAEDLALAYENLVPEHARHVEMHAPSSDDYREFSKQLGACAARVKRYTKDDRPHLIPADLEEPWCAALPEPYASRARRTLARRHGFIGAERPDAPEAGTDCNLLTDISNGSSQAMRLVVQALADGRLDEHDLEQAPALVAALDDLAAKAIAARARVIERTGLVITDLSVVGGRDRSA